MHQEGKRVYGVWRVLVWPSIVGLGILQDDHSTWGLKPILLREYASLRRCGR